MDPGKYKVTFSFNKQKVSSSFREERRCTIFARDFETNNGAYIVRFLHHKEDELNLALQKAFIGGSGVLNRSGISAQRVFNSKRVDKKGFLALLLERPTMLFSQLSSKRLCSSYFDFFKMGVQVGKILERCEDLGVCLLRLGPSQLMMDANGNFQFGNLDFNVGESKLGGQRRAKIRHAFETRSKNKDEFLGLAPEVQASGEYSVQSMIWDFGLLMYELFTGQKFDPAEQGKSRLHVDFPEAVVANEEGIKIRDLIEGCLMVRRDQRYTPQKLIRASRKAFTPAIPVMIQRTNKVGHFGVCCEDFYWDLEVLVFGRGFDRIKLLSWRYFEGIIFCVR